MSDVYFSPELLEVMRQQMHMSPSTWHKVMNPYCPVCMFERGSKVVEQAQLEATSGTTTNTHAS